MRGQAKPNMIIYDPEAAKPIQCSECGSREIVNPVNNSKVDLVCQNCGHEKAAGPTLLEREMGSGSHAWTPPKNPNPYREF